jgi:hypothetical protein
MQNMRVGYHAGCQPSDERWPPRRDRPSISSRRDARGPEALLWARQNPVNLFDALQFFPHENLFGVPVWRSMRLP